MDGGSYAKGRVGDLEGFTTKSREVARALSSMRSVTVFTHIDADGITAGAIASQALSRARVPCEVQFLKKLDDVAISRINSMRSEGVWLTDLGSGYLTKIEHPGLVIADHHDPDCCTSAPGRAKRNLFDFHDNSRLHLNPHLFGFDGSREVSGAGTAYWIARQMSRGNVDLSPLAIVGAVGDLQDSDERRLVGINALIREEAEDAGLVRTEFDLRLFGRETRPLPKLFQYASDPSLPGLSNDWYACRRFLDDCRIRLRDRNDMERRWVDLDDEERRRVRGELLEYLEGKGAGEVFERIYGEVYLLAKERPGSELHEAKEFSTLLNSCGRYDNERLGMELCHALYDDGFGAGADKGEQTERALAHLRNHRGNLMGAMNFFFGESNQGPVCERRKGVQLLLADGSYLLPSKVSAINQEGLVEEREVFRDTTVGIVAGMVLGSGKVDDDLPILAMMRSEGAVKVSARGNQRMVERGLDLSRAMREAAEKVGGTGGGHNVAAGATIPQEKVGEFIDHIDDIVARQMGGSGGPL